MHDFNDVLTAVKTITTGAERVPSIWFKLSRFVSIRIAKPDSFDNYMDVVARVTLFYNNKSVWDVLITYNTDLEKFCDKLSQKITEYKHYI